MAISPPSDIVLDVARAAMPREIEAARAALTRRATGSGEVFSAGDASTLSRADTANRASEPAANFKRFEAMVLKTFIQNMLPKDTEGVYGKGLAGDMWKSQLAEGLADVMAERGGIGIARSLLADHYLDGKHKVPVGPVSNGPQKSEIDTRTQLSVSLVEELQMKMARALGADGEPDRQPRTRT